MATFHVFARTAYADPLTRIDTVEAATAPERGDLARGDEAWLELVVIPDDAVTWVLRDGDLVAPAAEEVEA